MGPNFSLHRERTSGSLRVRWRAVPPAQKPQDLLLCKSLVELADPQREMFVDGAERVVREAVGPLQCRTRAGVRE